LPSEISAGTLVVRRMRGRWWLAAQQPQGRPAGHWALPKGHVEKGEPMLAAAVRETREEMGLTVEPIERLPDIRYVFARDGVRIFKLVAFWWCRPVGGRLGAIDDAMRIEVAACRWLPLADAPRLLAYRGEQGLVRTLGERLGAGSSP